MLRMNTRQVMTRKIVTIEMDDSVRRVRDLFEECGFHHVLVLEKGRLVGVISDRDLLRTVSPFIDTLAERSQDLATLNRPVHRIMTRNPVTVSPEMKVEDAARVMLEQGVSCLPVVTGDGRVVGIVTSRDLLRAWHGPTRG
jgi:acetoin utilization protein AcuB